MPVALIAYLNMSFHVYDVQNMALLEEKLELAALSGIACVISQIVTTLLLSQYYCSTYVAITKSIWYKYSPK